MKQTIKAFSSKSLTEATAELLKKLNIKYFSIVEGGDWDDYFSQNDFNFQYVEDARECVEHIYQIGYIDDTTIQNPSCDEIQEVGKYDSMQIFACEIKPNAYFPRSKAVALTRAFNRISTWNINRNYDMPVIVVMRQGEYVSLATCERTDRHDGYGEKVGKVTILRNMYSPNLHPGHRQNLERIANEVHGSETFAELYGKWLKSFSIEILCDDFFKQYKEIYEDIVEFVTGKRIKYDDAEGEWKEYDNNNPCVEIMHEFSKFSDPEKSVRDYVKKLMGRLVFIQFLQKKGWMGVPAGESWAGGDPEFLQNLFKRSNNKDTFVDDVLEPLFEDMNTNRQLNGDLSTCPAVGIGIKIPYLNGGLFEPDEYDKLAFALPSRFLKKLFDFFSSYNFTIDENAPDNVEIGVDPEMLGRIFENLLEDNKDKGAFYTPKFIVEYMCREALISYLQNGIENEETKKSYREFVTSHEVSRIKSEDVYDVDKKLRDVKICDPAIGSGAFPMGMLRELFDCRMAIEQKAENRIPSEIKKDIIQNSIYGVDIEKGAVDIARLRFWLSLIIEEETPHALPNMEFKIMQGNSLFEEYHGINLDDIYDGDRQMTLAFDEETQARELFKQNLINYFDEDDHNKKQALLVDIDNAVKSLVKAKTFGNEDVAKSIDALNLRNNPEFFLWHTWFNDVLSNKKDKKGKTIKGSGGFDIVIGNPPYVNVELMSPESKVRYKDLFKCFYKRSDMFALFMEQSLVHLANKNGIVTLIIPSVSHSNSSYVPLRNLMLNNHWLSEVCYTGGDVFPAPTVDTTILRCNKSGNKTITLKHAVNFANPRVSVVDSDYFSAFSNIISISNNGEDSLFSKLFNKRLRKVDDYYKVFQGIVTGNNDAFIFETEDDAISHGIEKELLHSLCHGRDIGRYMVRSRDRKILYVNGDIDLSKYPGTLKWLLRFKEQQDSRNEGKKDIISWACLHRPRVKSELDLSEKILVQNTRNESLQQRIIATIDDQSVYGSQGVNFIIPSTNDASLKFLLGVLNSSLINYLFKTKFLNLAIKAEFIKQVRLPKESKEIISRVERILSMKKENEQSDTSSLENEINRLVFELYGLTNEEVKFVNPNEQVSGEDCDLFKA